MKRKTTKEILAESFREIAENCPVDKITIQAIVDNCEYSPATFYRHFKDKYDLIAWDYVNQSNMIMDKVGIDDYVWSDTLTDGMQFYLENKEYIQNLLRHTSGHDAFIRYLSEANTDHLIKCILKVTGKKELDANLTILAKIYCFGTVQILCQWLLDEMCCDAAKLFELFRKALPDDLQVILCK